MVNGWIGWAQTAPDTSISPAQHSMRLSRGTLLMLLIFISYEHFPASIYHTMAFIHANAWACIKKKTDMMIATDVSLSYHRHYYSRTHMNKSKFATLWSSGTDFYPHENDYNVSSNYLAMNIIDIPDARECQFQLFRWNIIPFHTSAVIHTWRWCGIDLFIAHLWIQTRNWRTVTTHALVDVQCC